MSHSRALAAHSWSQGTPVALGSGKKRRREDDNNGSDDVDLLAESLDLEIRAASVVQTKSLEQL